MLHPKHQAVIQNWRAGCVRQLQQAVSLETNETQFCVNRKLALSLSGCVYSLRSDFILFHLYNRVSWCKKKKKWTSGKKDVHAHSALRFEYWLVSISFRSPTALCKQVHCALHSSQISIDGSANCEWLRGYSHEMKATCLYSVGSLERNIFVGPIFFFRFEMMIVNLAAWASCRNLARIRQSLWVHTQVPGVRKVFGTTESWYSWIEVSGTGVFFHLA